MVLACFPAMSDPELGWIAEAFLVKPDSAFMVRLDLRAIVQCLHVLYVAIFQV